MTPERAKEIMAGTNEWTGPSVSERLRPGEREEVLAFWNKMPGSTCFIDALNRIAKGVPAEHRYPRQGTNARCRCSMCNPVLTHAEAA